MQSSSHKFAQLFINDSPLLDVRAPIEFQRGAFPNATNQPLLDDKQREIVGKCYKQHGQKKAIEKGHELVHGRLREMRIAAWADFAAQYPDGALYCFRGGLRSEIAQQWLREAGVKMPRIEGGYKALRTFLIGALNTAATHGTFQLVGGKTGSAKTDLVKELPNAIDLEAAANHRGSSFGRHVRAQNNQINFENILAIDFLKLKHDNVTPLVLEDESRTIGSVGLPGALFKKMRASPIVVIEAPYETRLERLIQEYVVEMHSAFVVQQGNNAFKVFSDYLLQALAMIKKRLGTVHFTTARQAMRQALKQQFNTGEIAGHYDWLKILLDQYYDPMYKDGLDKRKHLICFRGDYQACKAYLMDNRQVQSVARI